MDIKLLNYKLLDSFPSGSGIEYFNDKVYLVGDDASSILVMNKRWKKPYEIKLFESTKKRIPKKEKADLEATALLERENANYLLVMGSGSAGRRNKAILLDLATETISEVDCSVFYDRLKAMGIVDLNIEGAAEVHEKIVFCNRGNKTNPENKLIITDGDFLDRQKEAAIEILNIDLSDFADEAAIGITGISYSYQNDELIFTAAIENTGDSYNDGEIGKSYLGIIENGYRKIWRRKIKVNELIDLPGTFEEFNGAKIESVCIQSEKDHNMKLHLVADNDNGETWVYKIRLDF